MTSGVDLLLVPWDHDFSKEKYDGLFISNGPGDPTKCAATIAQLKLALQKDVPIFGICLGNQLLALAAGCQDLQDEVRQPRRQPAVHRHAHEPLLHHRAEPRLRGRRRVAARGVAAVLRQRQRRHQRGRSSTRPSPSSRCSSTPRRAPARPTPTSSSTCSCSSHPRARGRARMPCAVSPTIATTPKPRRDEVLLLGSGGLSIGQAGEFDYSGSQAIKALKEVRCRSILINPNIATVQTSAGHGRPRLLPAGDLRRRQGGHREGEARRHPPPVRRPDGAQLRRRALQLGRPREVQRARVLGTPASRRSSRPRTARSSRRSCARSTRRSRRATRP